MNLLSTKFKYAIAILIGGMLGISYFMWTSVVNADTGVSQVSIGQNGLVMVRGARIVAISGSVVTVATQWGSTQMTWRVLTTGSTRFQPQIPSKDMPKTFRIGNTIAFTGALDMTTSEPTVYAAAMRDENLVQSDKTVNGSVLGIGQSSFLIDTENGTSSVAVGTGTIMTLNGNSVSISDIRPGDEVTVFGTLDVVHGVLSAERVTVASQLPGIPNTGGTVIQNRGGIFSGIWRWLRGAGSTLTLR